MAARWEKQFDPALAAAALNGELPAADTPEVAITPDATLEV